MAKMGNLKKSRRVQRARRHRRIRKKIQGTAERPRLVVFRSIKNIEGQLVDDDTSRTLVGVSTLAEELRGFTGVVFDRCGYKYHGRVKAFAEGARKGGLEF